MTTIQDIADKLGISKGTVSKALNNAPDISETLQKQILETAVELGYTKLRRYKNSAKRLCILVQKDFIQYEEPHHFAYDIVMGFRQMAEPERQSLGIIGIAGNSHIVASDEAERGIPGEYQCGNHRKEEKTNRPHPVPFKP